VEGIVMKAIKVARMLRRDVVNAAINLGIRNLLSLK
jgi:hypothetical protein